MSDFEQHLLYETAQEEVDEATPTDLPPNTRIGVRDVHNLMTLAWIRGAEWAAGNPALAKEAYDEANERRRADSASERT